MPIHTDKDKRHDFQLLFDVTNANPNGDPDAGNLPRVDPDTMHGLVTDVAIKRKVRDYVDMARGTEQRFKIYVQHGEYLTDRRDRVFKEKGIEKGKDAPVDEARQWMCDEFFDVRMFGAVMSMKERNAGQVRGPLQLGFAVSYDPIGYHDHTIVGPAQRAGENTRSGERQDDEVAAPGTMGRKATVPYALYHVEGSFNAHFARATGALDEDLALFWTALQMMWDNLASSSKFGMNCRGLNVFTHDSSLGNAPSHTLFDRIQVARKANVEAPRKFADYNVEISDSGLPAGVTLTRLVG